MQPTTFRMNARRLLIVLMGVTAMGPASAFAAHSVGTPEQVAWVRRAASRFVTAELKRDGAEACAVMTAPMRAVRRGTSCEQRWNAKLARLLSQPGERARLLAQQHAIPSAVVVVHGNNAELQLNSPLIHGPNRFEWTENCWMLRG